MLIVGIDEVGRGCWAGPVVAGAVLLNGHIEGLKDSKLLSKKQRKKRSNVILNNASTGIGWVEPSLIDEIGLTAAVTLAMKRALHQITELYDEVIIDGHLNFLYDVPKTRAIIKADQAIPAVSAASIIAKVARDAYMAEQAKLYPEYGFDTHVGYGTAQHRKQLQLHGITKLHRQSFKPIKAIAESAI